MAIYLDGIELPDLVIDNEFGFTGVQSIVEFSLGGKPIVWEDTKEGKPIDLRGTDSDAWISRTTLTSIYNLAKVPGAYYTLSYEGTDISVRFRNEDEPVISASPIVARPNQAGSDWYNNLIIKLMEA